MAEVQKLHMCQSYVRLLLKYMDQTGKELEVVNFKEEKNMPTREGTYMYIICKKVFFSLSVDYNVFVTCDKLVSDAHISMFELHRYLG